MCNKTTTDCAKNRIFASLSESSLSFCVIVTLICCYFDLSLTKCCELLSRLVSLQLQTQQLLLTTYYARLPKKAAFFFKKKAPSKTDGANLF